MRTLFLVAGCMFAAAAGGGGVLAYMHMKGRTPPWILSLGHGGFAAASLVVLGAGVARLDQVTLAHGSFLLFILAAAGGVVLASFHLKEQAPPIKFIYLHGVAAVMGLMALWVHVLTFG